MTATTTTTTPAFSAKSVFATDKYPLTVEGVTAGANQLTRHVAGIVDCGAKKVMVKTVQCPEGFFHYVEAWR